MSTFTPAETLRNYRPLLLAMEAIGWFHMAGKARIEFLKQQGGDNLGYKEREWHNLETPPFPWDDLLEWVKRLYGSGIPAVAWPQSFGLFTEKHGGRNANHPGFLGLLQAAHGIVSGVEKNLPSATSEYLNQTFLHMWLSSPWGYPKRNLLADPPEFLSPEGWRQLVSEIQRVLTELRELGAKNVQDIYLWEHWRKQAIGEDSFIRRAFLSTLAETRIPNNDVTLWDQSYVAAALFKSAVAGALLQGNSFPWNDNRIKSKTRWRLLTVAIGTKHYENRSVKIGDWTGIQNTLKKFFDEVARFIEIDIAIGSLIYHDSMVAVFSFPGERFDETVPASWISGWENWLQRQVEAIAESLDLETPPEVRLSGHTRSLVPIVKERNEIRKVVAIPVHRKWNVRWHAPEENRGHVCPVCRVRLNGDPKSRTRPCEICRERRYHRRNDWIQGKLNHDTIWFDEVADRNGRLALLTFSLDIEPWLNGERVDSLRAQAVPEWVKFNPVLSGQSNPIDPVQSFTSLKDHIENAIASGTFNPNDLVLKNLQEGYRYESNWKDFFSKIVEDRSESPEWNALNDNERASWFTHQLFRKLPSPGRVYRFWREAEEFFHDLLREFRQIVSHSDNPWRVRRLLLVPADQSNVNWKDLTLYDGYMEGQQISLVYVQSLKGFITASNLARFLHPHGSKDDFIGKEITLEEEDRTGQTDEIKVKEVREIGKPHSYLNIYAPVIPVEISPLRFRVLVPLESSSECVDLAVARWKERFAKVWDRLPLQVGVIAFPRKLSYQAVVEATRNVEDALHPSESEWIVDKVEKRANVIALHLHREGQTVLRVIPITMPDGRIDAFYPYMEVRDNQLRYPRDFKHPDGHIFRHVADLREGDSVKVIHSHVMTIFMHSTAYRFQTEKTHSIDDWQSMRAIWRLLRRYAPSQTAILRLQNDLEDIERSWRTPTGGWEASENLRRDTYKTLIAHHMDNLPKNILEALTQAAMKGWLTWALYWHINVLKESL